MEVLHASCPVPRALTDRDLFGRSWLFSRISPCYGIGGSSRSHASRFFTQASRERWDGGPPFRHCRANRIQHGYLLAPEIADLQKVFLLELTHDEGKNWDFFRDAAKNIMWPHIEQQYRDEMQGI